MITKVEFILGNEATNVRHRIYIYDIRELFPNYKVEFKIEFENDTYTKKLTDSKADPRIPDHFHLPELFRKHPNIKPDTKLIIEIEKPKEKYHLRIL